MTYRDDPPPDPVCPGCKGVLEPNVDGPHPWFCPACNTTRTGSASEAMRVAAELSVAAAEAMASKAAMERARSMRERES